LVVGFDGHRPRADGQLFFKNKLKQTTLIHLIFNKLKEEEDF